MPTIAKKLKLRKQHTATKYFCEIMKFSSTILISGNINFKITQGKLCKYITKTPTGVNGGKDGECDEKDEENV